MSRFSGLSNKIPGVVFCCLLMLSLMVGGCATISSNDSIGSKAVAKSSFVGKKMAVLPVQSQKTITTDSIQTLKITINRLLPDKLKEKFPGAIIIDPGQSMEKINNHNHSDLLAQIFTSYDATGFTPRKAVLALGKDIGCDYLVFSRLKAEKMDLAWVGKGFGSSLEVLVIDARSGKVVVGGVAQFKRGGIFGTGGTSNSEAAQELVRLVMEKL